MAARRESQRLHWTGGLCVYGIVEVGTVRPITAVGIEGRSVRAIESAPLAALVSDAPPGLVRASRRNLMAHSDVLQEAVAGGCVLPLGFGVVMPDEAAVRDELLHDNEQELLAQLDSLQDLIELDLKIVCPEEVLLRTILAERPELAALSVRLRGRPPHATYYERIRLGELVSRAGAEKRDELRQLVVDRVGRLAIATDAGEPAHDQMLVNVAFLVHRGRLEEVDEAVRRVNDELGPGLRLRYVGPLPPYRFVEAATGAAGAATAF
jgi:hypothetical protein